MSLKAPGGLVELDAVVDRQRLGHVDLHVVDVVAVPDRLEQPVGEPERQDVLRRLLPQEVVDTEDLLLVENPVHGVVERLGAGQVGPERLLHDEPGPVDQVRLAQHLDDVGRPRWAGCSGSGGGAPRRRCPFSALATPAAKPCGPADCGTKVSRCSKPAHCRREIFPVAYWSQACRARWRNSSSVSSLRAVPTMRYSGIMPDCARWRSPGRSLRAARSPVAPKRTMT